MDDRGAWRDSRLPADARTSVIVLAARRQAVQTMLRSLDPVAHEAASRQSDKPAAGDHSGHNSRSTKSAY
jgi:hypothetical protein